MAIETARNFVTNRSKKMPHSRPTITSIEAGPSYPPIGAELVVPEPQGFLNFEPERRKFLLFVAFDLVINGIFWISSVIITYGTGDLSNAFYQEVHKSTSELLHHSFFDLTILALSRFIWLMIFYGLLRMVHWWPVAITVVGSTVFSVLKLFYFLDFKSNAFYYIPPLSSVFCAWIEIWLLDFKIGKNSRIFHLDENRRILIQNDHLAPAAAETDQYLSATEGPASESSDEESQPQNGRPGRRQSTISRLFGAGRHSAPHSEDYVLLGLKALNLSRQLYAQSGAWRRQSVEPEILSTIFPDFGRVFLVKISRLEIPVDRAFALFYTDAEFSPRWNRGVAEVRILMKINESTDLLYNVAAPAAGGLVETRDFVDVRHFERVPNGYHIALMSVNAPIMPPQKSRVRGQNGPNMYILQSIDANSCSVDWVMNTNLKGRLYRSLVDRALGTFLVNFVRALQTEAKRIRDEEF